MYIHMYTLTYLIFLCSMSDMEAEELGELFEKIPDEYYSLQPPIIENYKNRVRGLNPLNTSQIGLDGLRNELIRMQGMIVEGLKAKQVKVEKLYKREDRKAWTDAVKSAETVSELRGAVQTLEDVVHSTQEIEDIDDAREVL